MKTINYSDTPLISGGEDCCRSYVITGPGNIWGLIMDEVREKCTEEEFLESISEYFSMVYDNESIIRFQLEARYF